MFYRPRLDRHGLPHNPFNAIVGPRPIGWISTLSADGAANLAPFSFFNGVSYTPPQVMFSGGPRPHGKGEAWAHKDSVANVEATGEFVCNIATWELREQMNLTSAEGPPDLDEFEHAGLTKAPSDLVAPPRVGEAPIHLECRYLQSVPLKAWEGYGHNTIIVGEVVGIHIDERVLTDGLIDYAKLRPIARLGYRGDYVVVDEVFEMIRPSWP
jgi:flavin reductase (DIM6/NTAB) family NADH-FMN oxidoreductase RutF